MHQHKLALRESVSFFIKPSIQASKSKLEMRQHVFLNKFRKFAKPVITMRKGDYVVASTIKIPKKNGK